MPIRVVIIKKAISGLIILLFLLWSCFAIYIDGPQNNLGKVLVVALVLAQVLILFFPNRRFPLIKSLLLFGLVVTWWLQIKPQNDRNWLPEVKKLAQVEFDGDLIKIKNVRNFNYRSETDFDPRWEERAYDLSKVESFDLFFVYWGPQWMAHAIASFGFSDGQHLAISIETRKEVGETYSALLGFFRQFELYYVVADEADVIKVRTDYRGEQVYLYNYSKDAKLVRALLEDYLREVNTIAAEPRWYNALTKNCSTSVRDQVGHVTKLQSWNWRMLANGYLPELAYMRRQIDTSLPFEELKRKNFVNERAQKASNDDFSKAIREGIS